MSGTDYKKSCCEDYKTRKQLFESVLELDYIKGPKKTFDIKCRLSGINDSLVDTVVKSAGERSFSSNHNLARPEYLSTLVDLHLMADFYAELKAQTPKPVVSLNSFDAIASLFKKKRSELIRKDDDVLAVYFRDNDNVYFVREDAAGRKYIELTEMGERTFNQIWNCNDRLLNNPLVTPFSKLQDAKKDLTLNVYETGDGLANVEAAVISKDESVSAPPLLLQNRYGSTGLTADEYVPLTEEKDEAVVGSRKEVVSGESMLESMMPLKRGR